MMTFDDWWRSNLPNESEATAKRAWDEVRDDFASVVRTDISEKIAEGLVGFHGDQYVRGYLDALMTMQSAVKGLK